MINNMFVSNRFLFFSITYYLFYYLLPRIPSPKEGRPIPVGFEIIKRLRARAEDLGIELLTGTYATELLTEQKPDASMAVLGRCTGGCF